MVTGVALDFSGQWSEDGLMAAPIAPAVLAELLGSGWRRRRETAEALADALRALAVDGRLAARTRVPSERALAPALGVGRGTVTRAYDRLREDGYLVSARGAGSWLTLPDGAPGIPPPLPGLVAVGPRALDLSIAAPSGPEPLLGEAAAAAAARLARHAHGHGYAGAGLHELRAAVADRLEQRGVATAPEQILITAGAQHGLHLVLALLAAPADRVLVDAPAYPRTLSAVRRARLRTVSVPLAPDGWDAGAWSETIAAAAPRLAITAPDFHNPTGLSMAAADRERIAAACARAGVVLVADETTAELRLDGPPSPAPLAAHDPGVVTLGSMSKAAWGGLRLGWIRATPQLVRELAATRADLDLASPVLEQLVAVELLARWEEVLESRRALLRPRRDALLAALAEHAPAWSVRPPHGGLSAWVRLPLPLATRLASAAARERLGVVPGPSFSADGAFEHFLRLPFTLPEPDLDEAVRTLASLAARLDAGAVDAPAGVV
jgi:DNA-binding transcriptional MocR family regulator